MKTTVSAKGRIVLPAEIPRQDGIEPGQEFEVERVIVASIGSYGGRRPPTRAWSTGFWRVLRKASS